MPVTRPIDVKFGEDEEIPLKEFVRDNLQSLMNSLNELHSTKVPEWRRLYKGLPLEEERNWPWPNCSNTVIQLIGENCDTLKARILGSIFEIMPIWPVGIVGEWEANEQSEEQRVAIEGLMTYVGLEPTELDLYRVESLACNDMVQLGTVVVKSPWETETEELVVAPLGIDNGGKGASSGWESDTFTKYDGPRPEKLRYEDWGAPETAVTIERANFKYHHYTLTKQALQKKIHDGAFKFEDKQAEEKFLASPDRYGDNQNTSTDLTDKNVAPQTGFKHLAEWDIYECWFRYFHGGKTYRIIYSYHKQTNTKLRAIFNFYPENDEPWELGRLGYTDDGLRGYGFAEMLKFYQEGVSGSYNRRADNETLANTSVLFAGDNPRVDANFSLYPGAVLPLNAQEAAIVQMGRENQNGSQEDQFTLALAKQRAGVDNPTEGMGSGTVNKKGGYSAGGTFAIMQAGNRRVNINITDFRYMHLKLGRRFCKQYAHFGLGDERYKKFGNQADVLRKALENIKQGRIELPIRAANSSINREVEKQNDMLLSQVLMRHQQAVGALLQGYTNPAIPPELKQFSLGSIMAMSQLMGAILRNFGHDDLSRLLPERDLIKTLLRSQNGQQGGQQQGTGNNQPNPGNGGMAGDGEAQGPNNPAAQPSGLPVSNQVLAGMPRTV